MPEITGNAKVSLNNDFMNQVGIKFTKGLYEYIVRNKKEFLPIISKIVLEFLNKNIIYSALAKDADKSGDGRFLRAEFGLQKQVAKEAAKNILAIVITKLQSPEIKKQLGKTTTYVNIIYTFPDPDDIEEELLDMPSASYESENNGVITEIPWMQWLLDGLAHPIDKSNKRWGITYDAEYRKKRKSRSRAAVMIAEPKEPTKKPGSSARDFRQSVSLYKKRQKLFQATGGPYSIPAKYLDKGSAQNFIDQVLIDKSFRKKLDLSLTKKLSEMIFKYASSQR